MGVAYESGLVRPGGAQLAYDDLEPVAWFARRTALTALAQERGFNGEGAVLTNRLRKSSHD